MPSLMEMVDRVNQGEMIDRELLETYQESANSAEKFLANHAQAMLALRQAHQHMLQSLEAIDYGDQKVLNQFISVSGFLGLTNQRAQPVVRFGSSAIARREYALGLEAIQNGVSYDLQHNGAYTADRENCQFVATQYERASQGLGWSAGQALEWNNKQTRIAYIVSSLADDEASSRTVRGLARHHDSKRFRFDVYSTEAAVRRDKQQFGQTSYAPPSIKRAAQTLEFLSRSKVSGWMASTDGDVATASRELANQLIKDRIDVAIFDASQADCIAATVANWEVARVQINLCRRTPLYSSGVTCVAYTDQVRFETDRDYWQRGGIDSRFVLEGIDANENLGVPPQRSAYGIPEHAIVLASSGNDLDRTVSPEFVDTIINILRAHPHAVYLLIGDGEMSWQKRKFESAGIGKRIGYAGRRKDLPGFLRIADIYLAEFPGSNGSGVLQAMSVEKPIVAMRCGDAPEQSQAASFAGSECTITTRDPAAYIERVSKIIREPAYRQRLGKTMRARVEQHFGFNQTARQIEQLCDQLIQQASESQAERITLSEPRALAAVA
ncbi:MAG TPA: glycosyltransferase [Tepidisphaeraceae bacterium]|nr:glycosyltransferase [Tepidisphaeraceae bacterium]